MTTIAVLALIIATPATLGSGIDRFLLDRDKGRLYDFLLCLWVKIDESPIPDLPRLMAQWGVTGTKKVFGERWRSKRAMVISFLLSSLATSLVLIFFGIVAFNDLASTSRISVDLTLWTFLYLILINFLPVILLIILINYPFDLLTGFIAFGAIQKITDQKENGRLLEILLCIVDTFFITLLACVAVMYFGNSIMNPFSIQNPIDSFSEASHLLAMPVSNQNIENKSYIVVLLSATMFIPIFCFMALIIVSMIAKFLLIPGKWFSLYFLERVTQVKNSTELIVFTLTGWLFSVIAAILTAILKIADVLA